MLFYWLLVVILKFSTVFGDVEHRRVIRQAGYNSYCTNPDNRPGTCITIKSCQPLYTLLANRGREPAVANYLRQSQCGSENGQPKVCCSSDGSTPSFPTNNGQSVNTQRTTTNRNQQTSFTTERQQQIPQSSTSRTTTRRTPNTSEDYSVCGRSTKKATRIVGGQNATLGDWPWMVALGYRTSSNPSIQFKCGASLISDRWVLTAAHCVRNIGSLTLTTARAGDLDLNDDHYDGAAPEDIPIDEVIPHPSYTTSPITNDIALLRLRNPVTFHQYIRPICILSDPATRRNDFYANKLPFITGWGATEWRGPSTTMLQEAQIETVDLDLCARNYSSQRTALIDERIVCAGGGGKDTCQGDSGGPLIVPQGNTYYLAGIVSFGIRCADANYPGVYTRVAYFSDWIRSTTGI